MFTFRDQEIEFHFPDEQNRVREIESEKSERFRLENGSVMRVSDAKKLNYKIFRGRNLLFSFIKFSSFYLCAESIKCQMKL